MEKSSASTKFPPELSAPTPEQQARINTARERLKDRAARFAVLARHEMAGEKAEVSTPHDDFEGWKLTELDALGTTSPDFAAQLFGQIGWAVSVKPAVLDQQATNAALAAVDGAEPRNELEAMLVSQMAAAHSAAMLMVARARHAGNIPAMQEYGTLANKLMRTFAAQIEALAKIRRGGEQKVVVEHVHVYPGGKAFVGAVSNGAERERGNLTNGQQPHGPDVATLTHASGSSVPSPQPCGEPLPVARSEGEAKMPAARRRKGQRRAIGQT